MTYVLRRKLTPVTMTRTLSPVPVRGGTVNAATGHLDRPASVPAMPFLAADVGGTYARVGLVRASQGGPHAVEVLAYRKLACADFGGLAELLRSFVESDARTTVRRCVLACAGQVVGDE